VLCAENGEIPTSGRRRGTGNRVPLFDPLFKFPIRWLKPCPLGRADRLDVDTVRAHPLFVAPEPGGCLCAPPTNGERPDMSEALQLWIDAAAASPAVMVRRAGGRAFHAKSRRRKCRRRKSPRP